MSRLLRRVSPKIIKQAKTLSKTPLAKKITSDVKKELSKASLKVASSAVKGEEGGIKKAMGESVDSARRTIGQTLDNAANNVDGKSKKRKKPGQLPFATKKKRGPRKKRKGGLI